LYPKHRSNVALSISDDANPAQEYPDPRTTPTRSALLRAALEYARRDLPIFPCRPGEKRPCWAKGVLENGHLNATTDPQTITAWWNRWPQANTGMPTGKPSGIVVVDLDVHKDGAWTLEELEENLGPLGDYMLVRSGSGGLQLWYMRPEGELRNGIPEDVLGPGVCIKGDGGYVVVAPSMTSGPYEVLGGRPGPCPGWLDEALRYTEGLKVRAEDRGDRRGTASLVAIDSLPIPKNRRDVTMTSIAGSLHDGTRDLAQLTADLMAIRDERCEEPESYTDAEVAKVALSIHHRPTCRPQGKRAPDEVQKRLLAFEEGLEAITWAGHASNRLSLLKTYVMLARKHGEIREDGVAVSVSNSQATDHNRVGLASVKRNKARLKEEGLIATDNDDRAPTESGIVVLLVPLPEHLDNPPALRCEPTHTHPRRVVVEEGEAKAAPGGGGRLTSQRGEPKRAWSATRARHGKPLYDGRERVGFLKRMGKKAELAVDKLEGAGGRMPPPALAGAMGIKRPRNMNTRGGWLEKLMDAGVVEREESGYIALTANWLAAWDHRRVEAEEEMDRERDRERYRRLSEAWATRVSEHAENLYQKRLDRMALVCYDGEIPEAPADGLIAELEPVEEAAGGPAGVPEVPGGSVDAGDDLEGRERHQMGHTDDAHPSGLAQALGRFLDRCPRRANESHSWLANYLWSEDLVEGKPTAEDVREALEEMRCHETREAA
jgi:hypothetical protein